MQERVDLRRSPLALSPDGTEHADAEWLEVLVSVGHHPLPSARIGLVETVLRARGVASAVHFLRYSLSLRSTTPHLSEPRLFCV